MLASTFDVKAFIAESPRHPEESIAFLTRGLAIALEHDLPEPASSAYLNLSDRSFRSDRYSDALAYLQQALELARRGGNRPREWSILSELTYPLYMTGRWDETVATLEDLTEEQIRSGAMFLSLLTSVLELHIHRGQLEQAQRLFQLFSRLETTADVQEQGIYLSATAAIRRAEGRFEEALEAGARTLESMQILGAGHQVLKQGLVEGIEAALALGERERATELLATIDALPRGLRPPYLEAHAHRFRGRLEDDAARYRAAAARFRDLNVPFWLAVTLLELGERAGARGGARDLRAARGGPVARAGRRRNRRASPRLAPVLLAPSRRGCERQLDLPLVAGDRLDPHGDAVAQPVGPAGAAAAESRPERVQLEELAVQAARGDEALEHLAEAHEEARADHADDLPLPLRVPAFLVQAPLEQPREADLVGEVLDLRRLALALRRVLGEARGDPRGAGRRPGRARAAGPGARRDRGSGGWAR